LFATLFGSDFPRRKVAVAKSQIERSALTPGQARFVCLDGPGIPERFLDRFGDDPPSSGRDAGLQERQQYCRFIFIPAKYFHCRAC
jgi:hypothetical protein